MPRTAVGRADGADMSGRYSFRLPSNLLAWRRFPRAAESFIVLFHVLLKLLSTFFSYPLDSKPFC